MDFALEKTAFGLDLQFDTYTKIVRNATNNLDEEAPSATADKLFITMMIARLAQISDAKIALEKKPLRRLQTLTHRLLNK